MQTCPTTGSGPASALPPPSPAPPPHQRASGETIVGGWGVEEKKRMGRDSGFWGEVVRVLEGLSQGQLEMTPAPPS